MGTHKRIIGELTEFVLVEGVKVGERKCFNIESVLSGLRLTCYRSPNDTRVSYNTLGAPF